MWWYLWTGCSCSGCTLSGSTIRALVFLLKACALTSNNCNNCHSRVLAAPRHGFWCQHRGQALPRGLQITWPNPTTMAPCRASPHTSQLCQRYAHQSNNKLPQSAHSFACDIHLHNTDIPFLCLCGKCEINGIWDDCYRILHLVSFVKYDGNSWHQIISFWFYAEFAEIAQDMAPIVRELLPGVTTAAQRFVIMLIQRQSLRLADDLDGHHSIGEWDRDPAAFARKIRPHRGLPPPGQSPKSQPQLTAWITAMCINQHSCISLWVQYVTQLIHFQCTLMGVHGRPSLNYIEIRWPSLHCE